MLHLSHPQRIVSWICCALLGSTGAQAQPAGQLYDPVPPADSAYLRYVLSAVQGSLEVSLGDAVHGVDAQKVSAYRIVRAGSHRVGVRAAGSRSPYRYIDVELTPSGATTLVFPDAAGSQPPLRFQDQANTNRLKARITLYHLADKAGPVHLQAGTRTVFSNVAFGKTASMQVNPVSVTFDAMDAGNPTNKLATASVSLQQGGTYSLFLLPGTLHPTLLTLQNQTERYTPKP
ncbi:DUF4397 domain-containing protein [Candidatus Symbiobacter mobilis]|uniref:Alginate biosynthesis protein AlgF n=1 Tax=Candidatus Symbiobacter mobilis CR TaxID=946483 RepID=U5N560_9BURK|nr:DUF4397 domain-containing protein [Candidatus Symbiobacter mobilis]AGX86482.1 hypothetical protein Cenrod_0359 [Candidatus Symbiobacter mobilis CR]